MPKFLALFPWHLVVLQKVLKAKTEAEQELLRQEDVLQRQREEDLLVLQEESAARLEAGRLASEKQLLEERLAHEKALLLQQLEAETEGKLRLEVRPAHHRRVVFQLRGDCVPLLIFLALA